MNRRSVIRWLLSLAAAVPFSRFKVVSEAATFDEGALDVLGQVADVVLPSALGPAGRAKVVADFAAWCDGYVGGAEMSHGYGEPRARSTPRIDMAGYGRDLAALEASAVAGGGTT